MMAYSIWKSQDFKNSDIQNIYCNNNYEIINCPKVLNNKCIIYFSSNALYEKDKGSSFQNKIIEQDYYEWKSINKDVLARKVIFCRDVWLSWYVLGINSRIDSIEKIIDWLKTETKGYEVITVGTLSGGYVASIVSAALQCWCLANSAQFSLKNHNNHLQKNPFLKSNLEQNRSYFYEAHEFLKTSEKQYSVLYFCPEHVQHDLDQAKFVKGEKSVHTFFFKSRYHGRTCYPYDFPLILNMDFNKLMEKITKEHYSPFGFSSLINGLYRAIINYIHYNTNRFYNKFMK